MARFLTPAALLLALLAAPAFPAEPATLHQATLEARARELIEAALEQKIKVDFEETPLTDVLNYLADVTDLDILLKRKSLEDAGIAADTSITLSLSDVSVRAVLYHALREHDLGWAIESEALVIGSRDYAEESLYTVVYDVADLAIVAEDSGELAFYAGHNPPTEPIGGSIGYIADYDSLIEAITSCVAPQTWADVGGAGTITAYGPTRSLIIAQTGEIHRRVATLLADLRQVKQTHAATAQAAGPAEPDSVTLVVYEIQDKRQRPGSESVFGEVTPSPDELAELIRGVVSGEWDAADAYLKPISGAVVVRNKLSVQRQVRRLLNQVRVLSL